MEMKKAETRVCQIRLRMSTIDREVRKLEERQDRYMAANGCMDASNYDQVQALMDEREKLYEEKIWLEGQMVSADLESQRTNPMKLVRCISERVTNQGQIVAGKYYYIDTTTMYKDTEGDEYVEVYDDEKKESFIGRMNTNHFEELMII